MKRTLIFICLLAGVILGCSAIKEKKEKTSTAPQGFAVIELYSSEGCSSCPPAERLMSKLIHKADSASMPVYIIEFHVDYWDYLGWKDSLANTAYTKRQQNYGDFFKLNSIYTPQAVINGKVEMVGSDEEKVNQAISQELQNSSPEKIVCSISKTEGQKIEINYKVSGDVAGRTLNFALVESGLVTHIKKGENANKILTHNNTARVFKTIKLDSTEGMISIDAAHVNLQHAKIICFLQNNSNMNITAATQISLSGR